MGESARNTFWKPHLPLGCPLGEPMGAGTLRPRPALLAALLVLCLVPRVWMALATHDLFPDSVIYLQTCRALEHGDAQPMLERFGLNTYPLLLMLLRRTGADWIVTGTWASVAAACLAVLPLFGWTRRMFDDRVATVACVLYAIHPRFIYVSPLILRDPTFWLLFNLAVYALWRAAAEVRARWIALAIVATILAAHTRVEGWLLLLPAGVWGCVARRRIAAGGRSVLGGLILAGALVAVCGAAAGMALPHDAVADDLADWRPWDQATRWLNTLSGQALWPPFEPEWEQPVQRTGIPLLVKLLTRCVKAHTYAYMLLALVGLARWWRTYLRADQRGLALFTLAVLIVLGVHFRRHQIDEMRYFLPMVLAGLPYMALGVMETVSWLGRQAGRWTSSAWATPAVAALLATALTLGTAVQIHGYERPELRQIVLGKWIRENLGPNQQILGSVKHMGLTAYYADSRLIPYPGTTQYAPQPLLRSIALRNPSVVVLWCDPCEPTSQRYNVVLKRCFQRGYEQIDSRQLPQPCRDSIVLVRRTVQECVRAAATNASRPR